MTPTELAYALALVVAYLAVGFIRAARLLWIASGLRLEPGEEA